MLPEGIQDISYRKVAARKVTQELLKECASLFRTNYGVWGKGGYRPGHPVSLPPTKLKTDFLFKDDCFLVVAKDHEADILIGHAFAVRFPVPELGGYAVWITQLVVHSAYRNKEVATHLVTLALSKQDVCAGLVSSHPYAVRALERATKQRSSVDFVKE
ncbi:hypothetical protein DFS34DRAFT_634618 [Phlyctochytrium arcticum]|nr:hypothetical protein DFS34DRAFT_634618 [Phlyctochytrium arcticum]